METRIKFGWVFIFLGVGIIIWALFSSYAVFTGKSLPPEIFKAEEETSNVQRSYEVSGLPDEVTAEMQKMIGDQLSSIFPTENIITILNLTIWSILAGIFIFGGGKIAEIGIKMTKE